MRYLSNTVAVVLGLSLTLAPLIASADMIGREKNIEGTVSFVTDSSIAVTSDKDKMTEATPVDIQIEPGTQFHGVASLKDLKAGDHVRVQYEDKNGQQVSISIAKLGTSEPSQVDVPR